MEKELHTLLETAISPYKVYPLVLPQGVSYPAVTYAMLYDNFEQTKDAELGGVANYRVNIYSRDKVGVKSAYEIGQEILDDIKTLNGYDIGTIIREIRITNNETDFEESIESFVHRLDMSVYHT
jgi:hypothetical protein